ncbi:MAG: sensor histidine kinase [Kiritimatiellia bacterium]
MKTIRSILSLILLAVAPLAAQEDRIPRKAVCEITHDLLTGELARPGAQVRLEGWISATAGELVVLSDNTGSICVLANGVPGLEIGHTLILTCTPNRNPQTCDDIQLIAADAVILQKRPPHKPYRATIPEISTGHYDLWRVTLEGVVTDIATDENDPALLGLTLESDGLAIVLTLPRTPEAEKQIADLLDTCVSVTGIVLPSIWTPRRYAGQRIHLTNPDSIIRLRPTVPTGAPLPNDRDIPAALKRHFPRRYSIDGQVIAYSSPRAVWLRSPTGRSIRLCLAPDSPSPAPGSNVRVLGFLRTDTFFVYLENAYCAPLPASAFSPILPTETALRDLLVSPQNTRVVRPSLDGKLVRFEAIVADIRPYAEGGCECRLEADGLSIPARFSDFQPPSVNSRIAIQGACLVTTESSVGQPGTRLSGLCILPRNSADIVVLSNPPWWTHARLKYTSVLLLVVVALVLVWNRTLSVLLNRHAKRWLEARLQQSLAELKVKERTRLAVELHDSLAQSLMGVALQLAAAERGLPADAASSRQSIHLAERMLQSSHDDIRRCIWDLRHLVMDERNLSEALRQALAPRLHGNVALDINLPLPKERIDEEQSYLLLRVIRELVLNAIRHGHATRISVDGKIQERTLTVIVTDNGSGFNPTTAPGLPEGHFGLQGVRERIRHGRGTLNIDSAPGQGARITFTIDLAPKE